MGVSWSVKVEVKKGLKMVKLLQDTCVANTPLSGVHTGFELWEGGGKFGQCSSNVSFSIVLYIHVLLKLIKHVYVVNYLI